MNKMDRWIDELLLDQAGDLSCWRRWRLRWALRREPHLRAEQQSLRELQIAVRDSDADRPVSSTCRDRIRTVAEECVPQIGQRDVQSVHAWTYAAAAVVVLLASVVLMQRPNGPVPQTAIDHGQALVEWVPVEWDAIFMELVWDTHEQLQSLHADLETLVVREMDGAEEELARELIELGKTI